MELRDTPAERENRSDHEKRQIISLAEVEEDVASRELVVKLFLNDFATMIQVDKNLQQ